MNDRYLFNAKRIDSGEWVIGLLARKDNKYYISDKAGMPFAFEVIPDTICQCTGLIDKNGTLIWENDIVNDCVFHGIIKYGEFESIILKNIGFSIDWGKIPYRQDLGHWFDKIEVIGNIFDNPELLEVE